jgi:hypothetical protein
MHILLEKMPSVPFCVLCFVHLRTHIILHGSQVGKRIDTDFSQKMSSGISLTGQRWTDNALLTSLDSPAPFLRTLVVTNRCCVGQTAYSIRVRDGDAVCGVLGCPVPMV